MASHSNLRARAWCFTINNFTAPHAAYLKSQDPGDAFFSGSVTYLIVGIERGATGTPHLQGYVHFNNALTASALQIRLTANRRFTGAFTTIAKGTGQENRAYCSKQAVLIERGALPLPAGGRARPTPANPSGLNTLIVNFQNDVKEGCDIRDIFERHLPVIMRYTSGCMKYIDIRASLLLKPVPKIFVCWGGTGTGKSHWIQESFGRRSQDVYWVTCAAGKTWYTGYTNQPVIVFDDFEPRNLDCQFFKLLLDKYCARVEPKGSQIPMTSKYIVFSSNINPATWYRTPDILSEDEDVHWLACQRRIGTGTVMHFTRKYTGRPDYHCGFMPHPPTPPVKHEPIDVDDDDSAPPPSIVPPVSPRVDSPPPQVAAPPMPAPAPPSPRQSMPCDDDDDDDEVSVIPRPRRSTFVAPRNLKRSRFVDDEAGCSDDDDEDEDDEEFEFMEIPEGFAHKMGVPGGLQRVRRS